MRPKEIGSDAAKENDVFGSVIGSLAAFDSSAAVAVARSCIQSDEVRQIHAPFDRPPSLVGSLLSGPAPCPDGGSARHALAHSRWLHFR